MACATLSVSGMMEREGELAAKPGIIATSPSFTVGENRLCPLVDPAERLDSLLAMIDGATLSLRVLYYAFSDDRTGARVRAALAAALGRGVSVSLIIDGFGSHAGSDFFAPLEAAGADTCRFIPRFGRRYLLRNHQKLVVADEARMLIGGFNIEDDYFADAGSGGWRDLGLIVEGPAAKHAAGYYDALQRWSRKAKPKMRDLRRALSHWSDKAGPVRWLLGGPTRRLNPWAKMLRRDMLSARRLAIIAAYFFPNPAVLRRIARVAKRGGEAQVMTAAYSDNHATIAAARHCYTRLLRGGVRVYEYEATKLHTKLIVIDDVVYLGSANLDVRSLYLNLELMLRVEDRAFADHMRSFFGGETADSVPITREAHRARATWLARMRWGLAYFTVGVLDPSITHRLNFGRE